MIFLTKTMGVFDWWFRTFLFSHTSSQLTFIFFRGVVQPLTGYREISHENPLEKKPLHEVGHLVTLGMLVMLKTDRLIGKSIGKGYNHRKNHWKNCGFMRFYGSYLLVN